MLASEQAEKPVVCRPLAYIWLGLFFALMGGAGITAAFEPSPNTTPDARLAACVVFCICGFLIIAGGVWAMVYAARFCVIADKEGLRLRDFRPWRVVPWAEVTDYYEQVRSPRQKVTLIMLGNVIETASGDCYCIPTDWPGVLRLKKVIEERAYAAKAIKPNGTTGWAIKGARPSELPATFGYDAKSVRAQYAFMLAVVPVFTAIFTCCPFLAYADDLHHGHSPTAIWSLCFLLTLCLLMNGFFAVSLTAMIKELRDGMKRSTAGERISADAGGLTVTDNGDERRLLWNDIIGYEAKTHNYIGSSSNVLTTVRVRTNWGYEFSFTNHLTNYRLLCYMLRHYASGAVERRFDRNRYEALGTIADRWTGGEEAKGDRVFHSKTRSNRAVLWFPWGLCGMMLFIAWLTVRDYLFNHDPSGQLILAGLFALTGAGASWWYYRSHVTVGKQGITRVLPWRKTFVAWSDVDRWSVEGDAGIIETRDGTTLRWTPSMLAYGSEIENLVRDHVNAHRAKAAKENGDMPARTITVQESATPVVNGKANHAR